MDIFAHWREIARPWSAKLAVIATAIFAWALAAPDQILNLWHLIGGDAVAAYLPAAWAQRIAFAVYVLSLASRLIKQDTVAAKIKRFLAWFGHMTADKSGEVAKKAALGLGAAGCVLTMSTYGYGQYERLEGNKLVAYADPATKADPWTICGGATGKIYYDGKVVTVRKGLVLTAKQCRQVNQHIVDVARAGLNGCVTYPLNQSQSDGLTLFAINIGVGGTCTGSVVRYVNAGDFAAAEKAMWQYSCAPSANPKYPHAHCGRIKRQMPGLLSRRKFEGSLMTSGDLFNRSPVDLMAIANHKTLEDQ